MNIRRNLELDRDTKRFMCVKSFAFLSFFKMRVFALDYIDHSHNNTKHIEMKCQYIRKQFREYPPSMIYASGLP
jgi:hypothetical protein